MQIGQLILKTELCIIIFICKSTRTSITTLYMTVSPFMLFIKEIIISIWLNVQIQNEKIANSTIYLNAVNFAADIISLLSFPKITLNKPIAILTQMCLTSTFKNLFKITNSNIKKVTIGQYFIESEIQNPNYSNAQFRTIILEYGVNINTYCLYKFLINSGIISSIEEVEFLDVWDIDLNSFVKLVRKYTRILTLNYYSAQLINSMQLQY